MTDIDTRTSYPGCCSNCGFNEDQHQKGGDAEFCGTYTDTRTNYTKGLRALADLLDTNPDIPLPHEGRGLDPFTFFIHTDLAEALSIREAMTDPHTERDTSVTFPVNIHGRLAGLPAHVYVHARIALAPGAGQIIPAPELDPRLAATLTTTEQVAS